MRLRVKAFSLKPRGKHVCTVCVGTACHVRGAPAIAEEFQTRLGIDAGETTPDKEFTLLTVNCLGACALGPIVVLDGQYFSNVSTTKVPQVIEQGRLGVRAGHATHSSARSSSTSSGLTFPASRSPATRWMKRPTSQEPVKLTMSTSGDSTIGAPASGP